MNRIRKIDGLFQVLLTPNIKIAPDSPIIVGNWEDENLRNYRVINFPTLNDAQCEAFKYPDIDWHRLTLNHKHIYQRLRLKIQQILHKYKLNVDLKSKLMTGKEFKNAMFDRVLYGGERFNMKFGMSDIISFTIVNPWSSILHKVSKILENERGHLFLDELRIRHKNIIDNHIICLYGYTEFGTTYEIKLMSSIIYQWSVWVRKYGYKNMEQADNLYRQLLTIQNNLEGGPKIQ